MTEWTNTQRETLTAICDCIFPSLPAADDPHGFWARKASDFGIDHAVAGVLDQLPPPVRAGMLGLVDAFAAQGSSRCRRPAANN